MASTRLFLLASRRAGFKAKGIDVSIKDGNGSSKTITLVAAAEYDIGHANLSAMVLARDKGLPVISVGHIVRKSDVAVIVPSDSGIKTPKDLEGKKVAMTPGGFADPFFDTLLKAGGTSRNKLTVIGVTGKVKTSTYVSGAADAMLTTAPYYLPLLVDKRPSQAILFADYGIPLPGFGLVANEDFVNKNKQATSDFVQIFFRSLAWDLRWEHGRGRHNLPKTSPRDQTQCEEYHSHPRKLRALPVARKYGWKAARLAFRFGLGQGSLAHRQRGPH